MVNQIIVNITITFFVGYYLKHKIYLNNILSHFYYNNTQTNFLINVK